MLPDTSVAPMLVMSITNFPPVNTSPLKSRVPLLMFTKPSCEPVTLYAFQFTFEADTFTGLPLPAKEFTATKAIAKNERTNCFIVMI